MVLPLLANFLSNFTIESALKLSSPEVGSSSRSIEGSETISIPIETLFLSPPERVLRKVPPIRVFATWRSPRSFNTLSTILSYSSCGTLSLSLAANLKASLGVKCTKRTSSCITYPATLPKRSYVNGVLSFIIMFPEIEVPLLALILSLSKLSSDVLPAPELPIIYVAWPGRAVPLTPFRIFYFV